MDDVAPHAPDRVPSADVDTPFASSSAVGLLDRSDDDADLDAPVESDDAPSFVVFAPSGARDDVGDAGVGPVDPATPPDGAPPAPILVHRGRARRPLRTAFVVVVVLSLVVAAVVGGGVLYARKVVGDIPKYDASTLDVAAAAGGTPTTYLIIGNDTREDLTDRNLAKLTGAGKDGTYGHRADTIIVAHVDPTRDASFVVSLPRDLLIDIPGHGPGKVNAALAKPNGEQVLVDTVQQLTGLRVNHVIEVDFQSFRDIVDAVGGVEMTFDTPVRDDVLLYKLPQGTQRLDGLQSLLYVRSRHFERQVDGRWKPDGDGDFGRMQRQREFLMALARRIEESGGVEQIGTFARVARRYVKTDAGFDLNAAIRLYRDLMPFTPERVQFLQLPTKPIMVDGVSYMELLPEAQQMLADLQVKAAGGSDDVPDLSGLAAATPGSPAPVAAAESAPAPDARTASTPVPAAPAVVPGSRGRVRILDGTASPKTLAAARERLVAAGFDVASTGAATRDDLRRTQLVYADGAAPIAQELAAVFPTAQTLPGRVSGVDVLVILGADVDG